MTAEIIIIIVVAISLLAVIVIMARDRKLGKKIAELEDTIIAKNDYIADLKRKVIHYETLIEETRSALAEVQLAAIHRKRVLADILEMIKEKFNYQPEGKPYQPPLISEEKTIL